MILTRSEIIRSIEDRSITISPFSEAHVNPNSYNYRLGPALKECTGMDASSSGLAFKDITLAEDGYLLKAKTLYLGHTAEIIGSPKYAMSLIGRSSLGRLGLFLQVSANIGHTGSSHQWTLELYATMPIILYPYMKIGQVSFWKNKGEVIPYEGYYTFFNDPLPAKKI